MPRRPKGESGSWDFYKSKANRLPYGPLQNEALSQSSKYESNDMSLRGANIASQPGSLRDTLELIVLKCVQPVKDEVTLLSARVGQIESELAKTESAKRDAVAGNRSRTGNALAIVAILIALLVGAAMIWLETHPARTPTMTLPAIPSAGDDWPRSRAGDDTSRMPRDSTRSHRP